MPYVVFSDEQMDDHSEITLRFDDMTGHQANQPQAKLAADLYLISILDERHQLKTRDQLQIIDLKKQVARQQEKLETQAYKNEALKAENEALANELAARRGKEEEGSKQSSKSFSKRDEGSDQQLMNKAELKAENERLRAAVDILRKLLQSYINVADRGNTPMKRTGVFSRKRQVVVT